MSPWQLAQVSLVGTPFMSPWHLARSLVKDVESGVEDEDEDEDASHEGEDEDASREDDIDDESRDEVYKLANFLRSHPFSQHHSRNSIYRRFLRFAKSK